MDCPRRFELVKFYAEGLAAVEAEAIRAHLAKCEKCRKVLEEINRQREAFLNKHPADEVVSELLAKANALARARRWRGWRRLIRILWRRRQSDRKP